MNKVPVSKVLQKLSAVALLVLLPACSLTEMFKGNDSCCGGSHTASAKPEDAVILFNGTPVVTKEEFESQLHTLEESQPALKQLLQQWPADQQEQLFGQIAESLAAEQLIIKHVEDTGLDKTAEYKDNAEKMHKAVERNLKVNMFQNELVKSVSISDAEAKDFYAANRDQQAVFKRPPFVTVLGGVKAEGFTVATEKEAKELAEKAKKGNFAAVAKEAKKAVVNFGVVNMQSSSVDSAVRVKVASMKVGTVDVVKGSDNKYYVVKATGTQDSQYADFDAVADAVKEVMMSDKVGALYAKTMADLKDKYQVTVDKEYLRSLVKGPKASESEEKVAPAAPVAA